MAAISILLAAIFGQIEPGDTVRGVRFEGRDRPYLLHVPPRLDPARPAPLVLALHPLGTDGPAMARLSGLSGTADRHGFLVAYPSGTGLGRVRRWNVGQTDQEKVDDVGYLLKVIEDVGRSLAVDPKRVYATGFSNGGILCYRLAAELPGRFAAIAPVAATMNAPGIVPGRPVSVLHFHGSRDPIVPFLGAPDRRNRAIHLRPVDTVLRAWAEEDGCPARPRSADLGPAVPGDLPIQRRVYGPGREGSEVILYLIEGGGHTWPGGPSLGPILGKSAEGLDANELIWEFFRKHPIP